MPDLPGLEGLPILVVDDNATNRLILEEVLSSWGARPSAVAEAAEALAALRDAARRGPSVRRRAGRRHDARGRRARPGPADPRRAAPTIAGDPRAAADLRRRTRGRGHRPRPPDRRLPDQAGAPVGPLRRPDEGPGAAAMRRPAIAGDVGGRRGSRPAPRPDRAAAEHPAGRGPSGQPEGGRAHARAPGALGRRRPRRRPGAAGARLRPIRRGPDGPADARDGRLRGRPGDPGGRGRDRPAPAGPGPDGPRHAGRPPALPGRRLRRLPGQAHPPGRPGGGPRGARGIAPRRRRPRRPARPPRGPVPTPRPPLLAALEAACGGDADFARELAGSFLDSAPRCLEAIEDALDAADPDRLAAEAHGLKGISRTIGADRAGRRLRGPRGRGAGRTSAAPRASPAQVERGLGTGCGPHSNRSTQADARHEDPDRRRPAGGGPVPAAQPWRRWGTSPRSPPTARPPGG